MGMYSDPPPPQQVQYSESMKDALQAQVDMAPALYEAEADAKSGRKAYARLEQEIIGDTLLGEGGGKVATEGGAIGLLAGSQRNKFSGEDIARRAGFDIEGNFMGTAALEEDMRQIQKERQVDQEIDLAKTRSADLTEAIRGGKDSELTKAISSARGLAQKSSNPTDITVDGNASFMAQQHAAGMVSDVGGPVFGDKIQASMGMQKIGANQAGQEIKNNNNPANNMVSSQFNYDQTAGSVTGQDRISEERNFDSVQGNTQVGDLGGLRSGLMNAARSDLALGGSLGAEERRNVEQDTRAAMAARGRLRDTAAIVDEVANLEESRRARENERRAFAGQIAGQESALVQSDIANQQQARMADQQADIAGRQRMQQAEMANQANTERFADRSLQARMADQQAREAAQSRVLQSDLANQQIKENFAQRDVDVQGANQQMAMANADRAMQAEMANQQAFMQDKQINLSGQMAEAERLSQANRDRLAVEGTNQNMRLQLMNSQVAARNQDIDRGLQLQMSNQQNDMQALQADRAAMQNYVGMEQATSADPFMAITGRPSGQTTTVGQSTYGVGAGGLGAGPQLYNPAQGAEFMANQAAQLNSYNAATYGADKAMWGGIVGGAMSAGGQMGAAAITACWVAREVFGESNPMWMAFRYWLFNEGPSWFKSLYLNYGERFAEFIKNKPFLKKLIRKWMVSRIKGGN